LGVGGRRGGLRWGMDRLDSIVYGPTAMDAEVSWRTGIFSDWVLVVGTRQFQTHRVVLARASEVLAASMNEPYQSSSTDLSELLPVVVHPLFELVLDEMYGGTSDTKDTQLVSMFFISEVLGMKALFEKTLWLIKCSIDTCAIEFVQDARGLPPSEKLLAVLAASKESVARQLRRYCSVSPEVIIQLSVEDVVDILSSKALGVAGEDDVFDFVWNYTDGIRTNGSVCSEGSLDETEAKLWTSCRLGFVSQDRLFRLWKRLSIGTLCPSTMRVLMDAMMYRATLHGPSAAPEVTDFLKSWYNEDWLQPRPPKAEGDSKDEDHEFQLACV